MKPALFAAAFLAACAALPAYAQRPLDPREYQRRHVGEPTQILVLGSPHLSGAPDGWDPAVLEPLIDRLEAFRPDAILIEALSGESIDALWRYREIYPEVATTYGGRVLTMAAQTRNALQMDFPDAEAEMRRTLAEWPASPSPAQRRRLAALFVAAGDPNSAVVQWWRLDPAERKAEDGISTQLMTMLNEYDTRKNENHLVGARLAVRLGLERLYAIDDHQDDDTHPGFEQDAEAFFPSWGPELMANEAFRPLREAAQNLNTPEQVMATYRMLNSTRIGRLDSDGQWLSLINRESPNNVGRSRLAYWETRNMRQAAHIREVTARYPGKRILVITGSAHKAWFDVYLSMMSDVQIVDMQRVLR